VNHKHTEKCWVQDVSWYKNPPQVFGETWLDERGCKWEIYDVSTIPEFIACSPKKIRKWRRNLSIKSDRVVYYIPGNFPIKKTASGILQLIRKHTYVWAEIQVLAGWYEREHVFTRKIQEVKKSVQYPWVGVNDPRIVLFHYKSGDLIQYYVNCPINGMDVITRRVGIAHNAPDPEACITKNITTTRNQKYEDFLKWPEKELFITYES
jgi:hypothetical protein